MRLALAGAALAATVGAGAAAKEPDPAGLHFTVRPSRVDEGETLDEKLARRERGFRFICIGCVRAPGSVSSEAPFNPIRTLNAPGLDRALAVPSGIELQAEDAPP